MGEEVGPVDVLEEAVFLDVLDAIEEVAVSLGEVGLQQVFDQTLGLGVEVLGVVDLALQDVVVDVHGVLVVEGVDASQHFVEEHAYGPPVHRLAMPFVEQHLGGQVLGGATQSVRPALHHLREAEVSHFQVALRVDQQVLRLEVSVDDVSGVEVGED